MARSVNATGKFYHYSWTSRAFYGWHQMHFDVVTNETELDHSS